MQFVRSFRVGLFLGMRQLRRAGKITTILIIFVMLLTFLNLVAITGILVGLPHGQSEAYRANYSGDILISTPENKLFIEKSQALKNAVDSLPEVMGTSARYVDFAKVEMGYKDTRPSDELSDQIVTQVAGINPMDEDFVTDISGQIILGEFLQRGDAEGIVISTELLSEYTGGTPLTDATLDGVSVGTKVRMTIGNHSREFTVRGLFSSKAQIIIERIFMQDSRLREMMGRFDLNVKEIAVRLRPEVDANQVKSTILGFDSADGATVELSAESQGQFITDIKQTFTILGNGLGGIGLLVAAITIFIVVLINAITRRRYIGILKGIGIDGLAIEVAYVFQAFVYVLIGAGLGLVVTYQVLVPYFAANPVDFPISDGVLLAPISGTLTKMTLLIFTTILAGYVPAKMIVRRNTLDAILGR